MSTFRNVLPVGGHRPEGFPVDALPPDTAPLVHTHVLADLLQSGASIGNVPTWSGTAWVPSAAASSGIGGSTGATDNRLLRADGTGGSTAQSSAVTVDDSGNVTGVGTLTCTAFTVDQVTYSGRTINRLRADGTNESVMFGPTGTGYITAQTPDGTTVGGDQRGANSVDWQTLRTLAARVASGLGSAVLGGQDNVASGAYSVAGGIGCVASGPYSVCLGESASATGTSAVFIGGQGSASGTSSFGTGFMASASGAGSVSLGTRCSGSATSTLSAGSDCSVISDYGVGLGLLSKSYLYGLFAKSSGSFAAVGDNQRAGVEARAATSDATPTNLFLDGSSARIVVPVNSTGVCTIKLTARTNTATGKWATAERQFSWNKGATAGSLAVTAVSTLGVERGSNAGVWPIGWALTITADVANGALDLQVTGEAATNIRWSAGLEWQEVTFA